MKTKRMCLAFTVAWLGIGVIVAQAQKEMPTAICKRGALIFEDEFKGKELQWEIIPKDAQGKIVSGRLTLRCSPRSQSTYVSRAIGAVNPNDGFIVQLDLYTSDAEVSIPIGKTLLRFRPQAQEVAWVLNNEPKWTAQKAEPNPAKVKYPVRILFEVFRGKCAISALGKSVAGEIQELPTTPATSVLISFKSQTAERGEGKKGAIIVIDNVKIWSAESKDADVDKDAKPKDAPRSKADEPEKKDDEKREIDARRD